MAIRPIYLPCVDGDLFVRTVPVNFVWHPGMAPTQKQKSIRSLHDSAVSAGLCEHTLEISSKSLDSVGRALSAFNLRATTGKLGHTFTVETAYQSSKCFKGAGPFRDLLFGDSLHAKRDARLKESGPLIGFDFFGERWPLEPKTAFYDWVYINVLKKNPSLVERLGGYDAFTDIEFNPKRSINCQAYSLALFCALSARGLMDKATSGKEAFLALISGVLVDNAHESEVVQPRLL